MAELRVVAVMGVGIVPAQTPILSADDLSVVLHALRQTEGVSIVSNPKIVVANEQTANIHIGNTQRPFISTVTPGTDASAPTVTYNPGDPVDFGVKPKGIAKDRDEMIHPAFPF